MPASWAVSSASTISTAKSSSCWAGKEGSFHGGFGIIGVGGIKKPAYYDYALLHRLGHERLATSSNNILVTRKPNGALTVAVWNLVEPDQKGSPQHLRLEFRN